MRNWNTLGKERELSRSSWNVYGNTYTRYPMINHSQSLNRNSETRLTKKKRYGEKNVAYKTRKYCGTRLKKEGEEDLTDYIIKQRMKRFKIFGISKSLTGEGINIPVEFDLRNMWGSKIGEVLNQGECQSCWAFATCQAFSDRIRIAGKGLNNTIKHNGDGIVKDFLSPYYLVSCKSCKNSIEIPQHFKNEGYRDSEFCDMGCHGGFIPHAHLYLNIHGSIPCSADNANSYSYCPLKKSELIKSKAFKIVTQEKHPRNSDDHMRNENNMKKEILEFGPIVAGYIVFENHLTGKNRDGSDSFTRSGLYYSTEGSKSGDRGGQGVDGHSISIMGWGSEFVPQIGKTIKYWLCRNSYGRDDVVGVDGYFRMPRGTNFCEIESEVWASYC